MRTSVFRSLDATRARSAVRKRWALAAMGVVLATTGCTSDGPTQASAADYRAQLAAACDDAAAAQSTLVEPTEATQVSAFALEVAALITAEADAARALRAPDELDDDHRAFVQNTSDQAAQWKALASTPSTDTESFGTIRTAILQLSLGRDDLSTAMGIDSCRRSAP